MNGVYVAYADMQSDADAAAAVDALSLSLEWVWLSIDALQHSADGVLFLVQWKPSCGRVWEDTWEPESSFVCGRSMWDWLEELWLPKQPRNKETATFAKMIRRRVGAYDRDS